MLAFRVNDSGSNPDGSTQFANGQFSEEASLYSWADSWLTHRSDLLDSALTDHRSGKIVRERRSLNRAISHLLCKNIQHKHIKAHLKHNIGVCNKIVNKQKRQIG